MNCAPALFANVPVTVTLAPVPVLNVPQLFTFPAKVLPLTFSKSIVAPALFVVVPVTSTPDAMPEAETLPKLINLPPCWMLSTLLPDRSVPNVSAPLLVNIPAGAIVSELFPEPSKRPDVPTVKSLTTIDRSSATSPLLSMIG